MYSVYDPLTRGLPHSDIHGSKPARGSPWLFAACHVLLRLLVPRHPPNALLSFNFPNPQPPNGMIEQTRQLTHHAQEPFISLLRPHPQQKPPLGTVFFAGSTQEHSSEEFYPMPADVSCSRCRSSQSRALHHRASEHSKPSAIMARSSRRSPGQTTHC
jgi:hypothetical protein